ncbi:MAG: hypothetical protein ACOC85_02320, partial [Thermoplasmatota archaeon]
TSLSGSFKIEGTLKGDEIYLKPLGDCFINKINGGDILVESRGTNLFSIGGSGSLRCTSIKGDEIYLENTRADLVEGDKVKIGPNCKIDSVKAENLKVHESSTIKNKKKNR